MPGMETDAYEASDRSHEWSDESTMHCLDCNFRGEAGDFEPKPEHKPWCSWQEHGDDCECEDDEAQTRWIADNDDDVMIDAAPSYWASYLINGDASGLDDVDHRACDIHCETQWDGWRVVDVIGEPYFSWSYHMHGGTAQGGELVEYVLHRVKKEG
jgi:hypothetical protein